MSEELDDLVDRRHGDPSIVVPLSEFLGMTPEQYAAWVERGAGCGCERCDAPRSEENL